MSASAYLIDDILVQREIHLMAGVSGAGKTTWLLQSLYNDWQNGLPVLGKGSHPVPWVYIASDRSEESYHRRLTSLKIPPQNISLVPAWDRGLTFCGVQDAIEKTDAKLAVIEAFSSFVDPPANYHQVKCFLQHAQRWAAKRDLTIIGVMESPKMKPYEKYEHARQRVSGVSAWSHYTETVFVIEYQDKDSPKTGTRILTVCDHNGPELPFKGGYVNGRLTF